MQIYELCFLILPSIPEDKIGETMDTLRKIVKKSEGVEIDAEIPFKYPLSYQMSKTIGASRYVVDDAYIGWIKFELEASSVPSIRNEVEKIPEILRFLLTKAERETSFNFSKAHVKMVETKEVEEEPIGSLEESIVE